jgi:predicted lipoprotein with Yx(FWY)xxD motif
MTDNFDFKRLRAMGAATVVLALVASVAAVALAAGGTATVGSASSSKLGEQIAVDAHGRTLYALSPETTRHLLCTSSECLKAWPPLTVSSHNARLTAGTGVHGRLGILRRSDGMFQVTLRGLPLYRFAGDRARGAVNGQGLKSFGGTWHAVTAAAATGMAPAGAPAPSPSEPASPGYSASGRAAGQPGGGGMGW